MSRAPSIAIIGDGASAVAMLAALIDTNSDADITIFGKEGPRYVGRGIAYAVKSPNNRLNVPAGKMSIFHNRHNDFIDWLQAPEFSEDFLPRALYGDYLADRFTSFKAQLGSRCNFCSGEVTELNRLPDGTFEVYQGNNKHPAGFDAVILTVGNEPKTSQAPSSFSGVWRPGWQLNTQELPQSGDVVIIGTGLSAFDVIVDLDAQDFAGTIYAVSRQGVIPFSHVTAAPIVPLIPINKVCPVDMPMRELIRAAQVRAHTFYHGDFRPVIDELRPSLEARWRTFQTKEQRSFLRHLGSLWGAARHRIPPGVRDLAEKMQITGKLKVIPGKVQYDGKAVSIRVRGRRVNNAFPDTICLQPELVVDTTGLSEYIHNQQNPLVRSLLKQKMASPDNLDIGFICSDNGELISAEGTPSHGLYAVGSIRRGVNFDCTAIRAIREHAMIIANKVATHLPAVIKDNFKVC